MNIRVNKWFVVIAVFWLVIGYLEFGQLTMTPEERELQREARVSKEVHKSIAAASEEIRQQESSCADEEEAFMWSQDFIKERLKSPSTAGFPNSSERGVTVKYMGNCTHKVFAYVDSQNGFGATLRTKYYAVVKNQRGTHLWTALEVAFLPD